MHLLTDVETYIANLVAFGIDLTKISTRLSITPNKTRENINNICSKKIFKKTIFFEQATALCLQSFIKKDYLMEITL